MEGSNGRPSSVILLEGVPPRGITGGGHVELVHWRGIRGGVALEKRF